ncbi:hypothetical protein [Streptomyces sp. DH12]|uniref:hypothetical protein n=1 Tax=Streptomyces sp. DH12 TaxID=2857010 RepID=UPI001E57BCF6|nr:hypothetical protein [Streptomyces sp. DH12]
MTIHYVAYTALFGRSGVARVYSPRDLPTWWECAAVIPGFIRGELLQQEPPPTQEDPCARP